MESVVAFKGQHYEDLLASLRHAGRLFEDPLFPATDKSMYTSQAAPRGIVWRRPREVRRNAQFVVDGFGRCDMDQGSIGNCWFIAGVVGIMQSPKLFAQVVPQDQSFEHNYAGIFHFRFWQYGKWVDVVVDDRLPFWSDGRGLVFAQNQDQPDEFWASLLEKAYAKLYGSYESLEAGQTTEALIDMSGGLEEAFDLTKMDSETRATLWTALYQASCKNSIMGCSITAVPGVREARLANGLVRGHAYTITKLVRFDHRTRGDTRLVRIRNPWGNEQEWKGAWSDHSREWDLVDSELKQEIGLVKQRDGEFWMSYEDFLTNWHQVQICHLSVNSFSEELSDSNDLNNMSWRKLMNDSDSFWKCNIYHSEWKVGKTAGGCGNGNILKFWSNPQFLITLNDVDRYDNENLTTVIIALMQKHSRQKRTSTQSETPEEYIQFKLYKIKDNVSVDHTRHLKFYANQLTKVGSSGSYINSREVTKRFRVEPGHYLIIPSTYDEDRNCEFMVRIFTEDEIEANSLEEDKDDITEEESFFQLDESDELFSSWAALMGEEAPTEDGVEESEEVDSASEPPPPPPRPTPKEKCSLM